MKILLGYTAATYMNLVSNAHVSEDPNIDPSFVTSHTYEVYLRPPGEGLRSPLDESEVKMKIEEP